MTQANRPAARTTERLGLLRWHAGRGPIRCSLIEETDTHWVIRWQQNGLAHERGMTSRIPKARATFEATEQP